MTHSEIMDKEFTTLNDGESFYLAYAKEIGFAVRKRSLQRNAAGLPCYRVLVCQKQGSRDEIRSSLTAHKRPPISEIRENCATQMRLKYE